MTFQYKNSGINNVAEYMASGSPFLLYVSASATPTKVEFPSVVNEMVFTAEADAYVGFSESGVAGDNKFLIPTGVPVTLRLRATDIYIVSAGVSAAVYVAAGLTSISRKSYPDISGSVGVG